MRIPILLIVALIFFSTASFAEIRIGYTSDLSSDNKAYGNSVGQGLDTYFRYINNQGGIRGQQINLFAIDNANDLTLFANSLIKLTEENVTVIIANPSPIYGDREVISNFLKTHNQVILSKNLEYQIQPANVINYKSSYAQEVKALINFAVVNKKVKYDQIGIYADDRPYAKECMATAINHLTSFGAWRERIIIVHQSDLKKTGPLLTNLASGSVKGMLMCAAPSSIPEFMAAAIKQLPQGFYFTLSEANTSTFAASMLPIYNGLIVAQTVPSYNANIPAAIEYKRLFKTLYPDDKFTNASFEGFILGKIIVAAVQASNAENSSASFLNGLNSFDSVAIGLNVPLLFSSTTDKQGINRVWYARVFDQELVDAKY